ncbi:roadblock/LC7 domain-containing protein [Saccharopolyspora sp. K220]|uniref:roadblock/LC7 domain-containing protein n=1 Tax=Saccharopolyspora soli TaxID=2926618 RepID=UPI001F5AD9D6|nr:roadblock/LC7 domain-containing protein [Saccharopolyspora soli]MCI2419453.1 roadblock/LC7 domain-containing protein [Saccharopolyspora soli]
MTLRVYSKEADWLLKDLVQRLAGVDRVVLLSSDGLLLGKTPSLPQGDAEHLSAVASGFQSLAKGAAAHFNGGEVYQTVVEMANSFLMVTAASEGTCLALLAAEDADLGMIAFEANRMISRVGDYLTSAPRQPAGSTVDT